MAKKFNKTTFFENFCYVSDQTENFTTCSKVTPKDESKALTADECELKPLQEKATVI